MEGKEKTLLIISPSSLKLSLSLPTPSSHPSLPSPPCSFSPLTVKLFRATSAACLIKLSFLQITIRKRTALLNHITTTSYKTVYLLLYGERGKTCKEKQRQHKWLHYTLIISLYCCDHYVLYTALSTLLILWQWCRRRIYQLDCKLQAEEETTRERKRKY